MSEVQEFDFYGQGSVENTVDWDARNKYIVDTVGAESGEPMVGVISQVIDLGMQQLENSTFPLEGDDVDLSVDELLVKYAKEVEDKGISFEVAYNGQTKQKELMKSVPQKVRQCVAYAVDFPNTMLDIGQFHGQEDSVEKPLRMYLNGEWFRMEKVNGEDKRISIVQSPTPLAKIKCDKRGWTLRPTSLSYKLADATGVVGVNKPFDPKQLPQLLGKAAQFNVLVGFNEHNGTKYLVEKIKLMGKLMKGTPVPELERTVLIGFNTDNKDEDLLELRQNVKNTIMRAENYEGSKIQEQFKSLGIDKGEVGEVVSVDNEVSGDSSDAANVDASTEKKEPLTGQGW